MRIQHRRCSRIWFFRDRHLSHDRMTGDGRCSAEMKRCLPGRRWCRRRRERTKLGFVLNERRWGTSRKRREDRNDRHERHKRWRVSLRSARDHGRKTITTDYTPPAHRHAPPPTLPNPTADHGRTAAAISLVQGWLRNCLGVMVLPHARFSAEKRTEIGRGSAYRSLIAPRRPTGRGRDAPPPSLGCRRLPCCTNAGRGPC